MEPSNDIAGSQSIQTDRDGHRFASVSRHKPAATSRSREIPEFIDLVVACWHRPLQTALVGGVLSLMLASTAWLVTDQHYEAEALVRVREQQDVIFAAQTSRAEDAAFFRSQEKLLLSPQVLTAALRHEEVRAFASELPDHNEVEWLRKLMWADIQPGSEVMSIVASHASPQLAHALANAVAQAYLQEVTSRLSRDRKSREQKLEQAALAADRRLDELWAELNRVAQSVGSDSSQSLTVRDELQFQIYRDYTRRLQAAQLRGEQLRRSLEEQQPRFDAELTDLDPETEALLRQHPDVVSARERVQQIDSRIQQIRQVAASDDSPRLKKLFEDREHYAAEHDRTVQRIRNQLQQRSREQRSEDLEASLARLRKQIEQNRLEKDFLRKRISELDVGISRTDDKNGVHLDMSRHAVERQTRLADRLWQSLQELKIESQSQPRVTLLELAEFPQQANHSRRLKATGAAGGVSWLLAIFAVGYLEWRDCRVRCAEDVSSHSALPVFGAGCAHPGTWFGRPRKHVLSGAREAASRILLQARDDQTIPTLMVSSSISSEPRHLVSLELAQAFAQFRQRTLIIDCDADHGRLSRSLGAQRLPGVRQLSPSGADALRYIVPSDQEGIDFLPVGTHDDAESWIDPETLKSIIACSRANYHAIVVNGPAVMPSADCLLLACGVDMLLLSVFIGTSRWNQLAVNEQAAGHSRIPLGGSILHSGKRSSRLQLRFDGRSAPPRASRPEADEAELYGQLSEMQDDLEQLRPDSGGGEDTPLATEDASPSSNTQ